MYFLLGNISKDTADKYILKAMKTEKSCLARKNINSI